MIAAFVASGDSYGALSGENAGRDKGLRQEKIHGERRKKTTVRNKYDRDGVYRNVTTEGTLCCHAVTNTLSRRSGVGRKFKMKKESKQKS